MILYATKKTFERYKLKLPEELTPPVRQLAQQAMAQEGGTGFSNGVRSSFTSIEESAFKW